MRKILAGWILQTFDLVQIMMIKLIVKRLEGPGNLGEIHDPSRLLLYWSTHMNFDPEGMPMQPPAFMLLRNVRQLMCRFDGKELIYFHKTARKIDRTSLTSFARPGNRATGSLYGIPGARISRAST